MPCPFGLKRIIKVRFSKNFAFTLVEFAIILVVIGLLIGFGATLIGTLTKRTKYTESKEAVKRAVEAFKGYGIRFGYLPPARPINNYNPSSSDPAFNQVGVNGFDSQGKALLYVVSSELTNNSTDLCNLNSTSLSIIDKGEQKNNIAFMIVSGSLNFNIQTNTAIYNQGQNNIDDFPYDFTRPEEYDDIVDYVSLFELQQQRCSYASFPSLCTSLEVYLGSGINSYKKTGGACSSGNFVFLNQTDYLETYIAANCNNLCGNFTYSNLLLQDINKNCKVQIQRQGNNCIAVDF